MWTMFVASLICKWLCTFMGTLSIIWSLLLTFPQVLYLMEANRRKRLQRQLLAAPEEESREFELWNRNQVVSPFLRLPPEIRNRIYEFTLYVGIVKVDHRPTRYVYRDGRVTSTRTRDDLREIIPGGFLCHQLPIDKNPFTDDDPVKPRPRGMTLLSPVCRQLYHETAALPFALNYWYFDRPWMLDRYIMRERRLPRAQRRAIRVLYLDGRLSDEVLRLLSGLEFWICPLNGSKKELLTNYITRQGDTIRNLQKGPIRWQDDLNFKLYEAGTVS